MIEERHRIEHKKVRVSIPVSNIYPPSPTRNPASRSGVAEGQDRCEGGGKQEKTEKNTHLRPICIRAGIRHGQEAGLIMPQLEVLICTQTTARVCECVCVWIKMRRAGD